MDGDATTTDITLNGNGTVLVPLRAEDGSVRTQLLLPAPSMSQLAKMSTRAGEIDDVIPNVDVPTIPEGADAATLRELQKTLDEQLKARRRVIYGPEIPYGNLLVEIISMLTDEVVTVDDLYGSAMDPRKIGEILGHFQNPSPGGGA